MKSNSAHKIIILWFLLTLIKIHKTEAQIIVRLWEAEASVTANISSLALIKPAEVKVKDKMTQLNSELRKKIPYYSLMTVFNILFQINTTTTRIRDKLDVINKINNRTPLLFNRKKRKKTRKFNMYRTYLASLNRDIGHDFSNNGNLLKTSLVIVSELEKIEKDLDETLEDLTVSERLFNLF